MAMHVFSFSPTQQDAAQQIYSGAYNYALANGGSQADAQNYANVMLGVASGEGLSKANPWSGNPDAAGTSFGPFQLYNGGGLANQYGINAASSPAAQMNAAFSASWNGGNINTQPWNAVGDTIGSGPSGNNSAYGQSQAASIGAQLAQRNGLTLDGASTGSGTDAFGNVSVGPDNSGTFQPSTTSGMESQVAGSDSLTGLGHLSPAYDPNGVGYNALTSDLGSAAASSPLSASGGAPNLNYGDFTTSALGWQPPTADAGQAQSGGVAVNITDLSNLPKAVTEAGKAVGSGETSLSQGVQAAASNLSQTGVSAGTGFIARTAFILAGLVLLIGAFIFFYMDNAPKWAKPQWVTA